MEQRVTVETDEIPFHAHRLYIKLYCERKGGKDKNTIQEAKKSWTTLSLAKKKLFYKTSANRNLLKYAHSLCKTKTFLKKKKSKNHDNELENLNRLEDNNQKPHSTSAFFNNSEFIDDKNRNEADVDVTLKLQNYENNSGIVNNTSFGVLNEEQNSNDIHQETLCEPTPSIEINETRSEDALEIQSNTDSNQDGAAVPLDEPAPPTVDNGTRSEDALETQSNTDSNRDGAAVLLDEPAPPTVKIGKDLYEIMKSPGDNDWKDITKKEKNDYNSAVRTIKREYIKKYTKYLESLSQHQLFNHYMKTLH